MTASLWDRSTALQAFLVRFPFSNFVSMSLIVTALKWFDAQGSVSDYEGGRDLESLVALWVHLVIYSPTRSSSCTGFASITQKSGVKSNIKPPPPPATLILDSHTFDEVVFVWVLSPLHASFCSVYSHTEQGSRYTCHVHRPLVRPLQEPEAHLRER